MYTAVLTIQYISIVVVWVCMTQVFYSKHSKLQQVLTYILLCDLINQLGMLFNMQAKTADGALIGIKIAYLGKLFVIIFIFFFVMGFCKVKIPTFVKALSVFIQAGLLACVWTCDRNALFYSSISFDEGDMYPHLVKTAGPAYMVFVAVVSSYTIIMITACIVRLIQSKEKEQKIRLLCLLLIPLISFLSYVIYKLKLFGIYDCTSIAFLISTLILIYAISRYELIDFVSEAKEMIIDEISDSILVLNEMEQLVYYNKPAVELFPEISELEGATVVGKRLEAASLLGGELWIDSKLYTVRFKEIKSKNKVRSKIYTLTDNTSNFRMTYEDGLTSVGNRRALMRAMEDIDPEQYTYLVIMDIDDFKGINDSKGHKVGDDCLVKMASFLAREFGKGNVFRFGGDEFVLLLNITIEELERKLVELNANFSSKDQPYPFNISGGYVKISQSTDMDALMKRADDALYEVKKSGKGRFALAK